MIVDYFKLNPEARTAAKIQIKEIFFESSSRKDFKNEVDKENFFNNWTSYYLNSPAQHILLWQNDRTEVQSYLMGCNDSHLAKAFYESRIPSYLLFEDLFFQYPAHLHINSSPEVRGQGVGSKLLQHYLKHLLEQKVRGVHLVTSPDSRNVDFYKKNGFDFSMLRSFKDSKLLFLGQELFPV